MAPPFGEQSDLLPIVARLRPGDIARCRWFMKRVVFRFGAASLTVLLVACSTTTEQLMDWSQRDAASKVAREFVATSRIELKARFNPWGGGIFVYGGGIRDLESCYVWISLKPTDLLRPNQKFPDDTFALSREAASLTPEIPLLSTASDDVRTRARLTSVPWDDIAEFLQTGSWPPRRVPPHENWTACRW
jgi:hypothetical protein